MASSKSVLSKIFKGTTIHAPKINEFVISQSILGVNTNGKIAFFRPYNELNTLKQQFCFDDASLTQLTPTQFLIPGFVDTHIHAPQYPNTGLGLDKPLMDWLNAYTFPMERQFSDKAYASRVYSDVIAHTLRNGTTTASYFTTIHTESAKVMCDLMKEKGQRGFVGRVCMDVNSPEDYCESLESAIQGSKDLIEHIRQLNTPLIGPVLTPRFAPTCSRECMKALGTIASQGHLNIQTHLAENKREVEMVRELFPEADSYTEVYESCGLLTERTTLAHCIHLSPDEIATCREHNAGIAHCPVSNFALKSGVLDCRGLLDQGLKLGLGTDVSGGYSVSMLEVMRQAVIASICVSINRNSESYKPLTYQEAFYLATLGGAKVLGVGDRVGSFEEGKEFDALLVDLESLNSQVYVYPGLSDRELFQKFFYNGDDRNLAEVYVRGRKVNC